jgi:hypothetical protein
VGPQRRRMGEVVIGEGGDIVTQNFDRYQVERMQSVPEIEVHLIDSDEPPTGVGEVDVPTTRWRCAGAGAPSRPTNSQALANLAVSTRAPRPLLAKS